MLKKLYEQRADKVKEMEAILEKAKTEERAFTEVETTQFDKLDQEIKAIDVTIKAEERARNASEFKPAEQKDQESQEELEERAFADYIKGRVTEMRAGEQNFTTANNGALIPTSIANRIIKAVKDICPIFAKCTMYHVKGTLKIPVYGDANTSHNIAVGYAADFTELTADAGQFISVDLSGFLCGALSLIGREVANNSVIDLVSFVVNEMAERIAQFIEKELLVGTSGKCTGALSTNTSLAAASSTAITADELIDLQSKVKQAYQARACWTMNPSTFTAVKKLKDENGRYLLQDDVTGEFPYRLLGKPVYLSDNMPEIGAGNKAVLYGDYSGLAVNMQENISIEVLREKYATQHALGVVGWFEIDSEVADHQKLAVLTMNAT